MIKIEAPRGRKLRLRGLECFRGLIDSHISAREVKHMAYRAKKYASVQYIGLFKGLAGLAIYLAINY
jgi:hypothetical protein